MTTNPDALLKKSNFARRNGGYAGNVYDMAYGKAMLQAALIAERG